MADASSQELPELPWLDRSFVEGILSREEGRAVTVVATRVAKAVGKGENYASLLLRVGVDFTTPAEEAGGGVPRSTSLIVKALPLGELMQAFVRESGAFGRERDMYFRTLPAVRAVLEEAFPDERRCHLRFFPEALRCDREETLVLRDLRDRGFRMSDRHAGLDLAHAALVLRRLARLHGASVAVHARQPSQVEAYTDIMYREEKKDMLDKFIPPTLENVAKVVESWTEPAFAGYAEKMRNFSKTAIDRTIDAVKPSTTFLNVLNHGDCWVNNCMFKYKDDEGKDIEEMKFVDFQIARYASPSLDLQYFLYTSVSPEVRETHWHDLLTEYVDHLNETLRAVGHGDKAIAVGPLEEEMSARGAFGLVSSCTVLCAVLAEPTEAPALDELTQKDLDTGDGTLWFDKVMSGDRFNAAFKRLLPHFVRTGVL